MIKLFLTIFISHLFASDSLLELASWSQAPERDIVKDQDAKFAILQSFAEAPGVQIGYRPGNPKRIMSFTVQNSGSSKMNPRGLKNDDSLRTWHFQFTDRARESIYMVVRDQPFSGRDSHVNMQTEMHLFPRNVVPSIKDLGDRYRVTLPTGETVDYDRKSREVIAGPFKEQAIDYNSNRQARANPKIDYNGNGLSIKVSQRGENPRYAEIWGQKKSATISYPSKYSKSCSLSPALLWDHKKVAGEDTPPLTPLYKTDLELYKIVERHCHWDLSGLLKMKSPDQTNIDGSCAHCGNKLQEIAPAVDPIGELIKSLL